MPSHRSVWSEFQSSCTIHPADRTPSRPAGAVSRFGDSRFGRSGPARNEVKRFSPSLAVLPGRGPPRPPSGRQRTRTHECNHIFFNVLTRRNDRESSPRERVRASKPTRCAPTCPNPCPSHLSSPRSRPNPRWHDDSFTSNERPTEVGLRPKTYFRDVSEHLSGGRLRYVLRRRIARRPVRTNKGDPRCRP